jgi:formylglycine-generating enzyme
MITLTLLALGYQTASATTILETFGSGANEFTMEFKPIGNAGNVADTTGSPNPAGSVAYTYNLGKYEVSRDMITKANSAGSLGITMYDISSYGGNGVNRPATGINWYGAATYVNWLNTSQGYQAAYKFNGSGNFQLWSAGDAGYNASNLFRNGLAKYVIPSSDEWYKAAYGNPDGGWLSYADGSYFAPTAVASGTDAYTAVYNGQSGPADINNAGGLSPYGTMAQGGNVWEWNETAYDGTNDTAGENRQLRGGAWNIFGSIVLDASSRSEFRPAGEDVFLGFRVASVPEPLGVPEPSTGLLVVLGLGGLLLKRRKTSTV